MKYFGVWNKTIVDSAVDSYCLGLLKPENIHDFLSGMEANLGLLQLKHVHLLGRYHLFEA